MIAKATAALQALYMIAKNGRCSSSNAPRHLSAWHWLGRTTDRRCELPVLRAVAELHRFLLGGKLAETQEKLRPLRELGP